MAISHGWLDNLPWSMDPSYLFWGISPLGPQQPFMTPWTRPKHLPRFKIHDTSVSSMLLSFLASRICRAIRSAIFLRMLASWHGSRPRAEKTCGLPGVQWIYVWGVFDSYENTNIYIFTYERIWRIYIYIYEYKYIWIWDTRWMFS